MLKSNGLPHSKNLPEKFGFLPIDTPANIAKKLPPQRCFKPLFIAFFNFSHKRSTFAFAGESGYTLGFRRRIAHKGLHGETGAFRMGVLSLPSDRSARSQTSPGRVSERRTLPLLGLGRGCSQRTQRAFGTAMRLCASLFRGVAAPLGCVICLQLGDVAVFSLCAQYFLNVRGGGGITTLGAFRTFTNIPGPGVRTAYFAALGSWPGGALEERRKPSGQRCAYACRCSEGVAAPLGFSLLLKLHLCAPRSGLSTLARCGGVTTALGMLCALSKCSVRSFQNGLHLCPHSGVGNIPTFPQRIAHNVSHVEGGSFSSEATVASDLPSDFYKYVNCINNSACRFCCNCFCGMVR